MSSNLGAQNTFGVIWLHHLPATRGQKQSLTRRRSRLYRGPCSCSARSSAFLRSSVDVEHLVRQETALILELRCPSSLSSSPAVMTPTRPTQTRRAATVTPLVYAIFSCGWMRRCDFGPGRRYVYARKCSQNVCKFGVQSRIFSIHDITWLEMFCHRVMGEVLFVVRRRSCSTHYALVSAFRRQFAVVKNVPHFGPLGRQRTVVSALQVRTSWKRIST